MESSIGIKVAQNGKKAKFKRKNSKKVKLMVVKTHQQGEGVIHEVV
jgi:hypothetical protein